MLTGNQYVQKSKLFLLPLIELKRDPHIRPISTYLKDKGREIGEYKLIVPFEIDDSSEFNYYENNYILTSKCLDQDSYYETDKLRVYVFDLKSYQEDYDKFLEGKYTTFSTKTKTLINIFWGKVSGGKFIPHPKIESYINPVYSTYQAYSKELNVNIDVLMQGRELIDKPDVERETLDTRNIQYTETAVTTIEN